MRATGIFIAIVIQVTVIILVALYLRHRSLQLFYRERMAALEKGAPIPVGHTLAPWSPRVYLLRGLLWSFGGAALIICLLAIVSSTRHPPSASETLWQARNLAQSLNIPAEEARQIAEKERETRRQGLPWSIALLGLIPVGVGLAYLVFYHTGRLASEDTSIPRE